MQTSTSTLYTQCIWRYWERTTTRRQSEAITGVSKNCPESRPKKPESVKTALGLHDSIKVASPHEFWSNFVSKTTSDTVVVSISGDIIRDHIRDQVGEMSLPL